MRDVLKRFRGGAKGGAAGGALLAVVIVLALGCVYVACANSLHRTCFVTGWALFVALTIAFARRFLRLRAGESPERWVGQQVTLAAAIVTLFLMHVEFSRPNGWLDGVLAGLFVVVIVTGMIGALLWTQLRAGTIASDGAAPDGEHARRHEQLRRRAVAAMEGLGGSGSGETRGVIGEFFDRRARFWRRALLGSDLARTLRAIESLKPGSGNAETKALDSLATLAIEKDRLDALRAGDHAVRHWLLVHMPCVACLLALGAMHGMIAHAHGLLAHVMLGK
jgi:hypothetical protein